MKNISTLLILLLASKIAFGSEGGEEHVEHAAASVMSLKYPFINFVIYFGGLFYLLKDKVRDHFRNEYKKVKADYEQAKAKEAELQAQMRKVDEKLKNAETEAAKIVSEVEYTIQKIEEEIKQENANNIMWMKREVHNKLEFERDNLDKQICSEALQVVLEKTKSSIHENKTSVKKVEQKLMVGL